MSKISNTISVDVANDDCRGAGRASDNILVGARVDIGCGDQTLGTSHIIIDLGVLCMFRSILLRKSSRNRYSRAMSNWKSCSSCN